MNCQAYINGGKLNVMFNRAYFPECEIELGDALLEFSLIPERLHHELFEKLRADFLRGVSADAAVNELTNILRKSIEKINGANAYLNFYLDAYMALLLCLRFQRSRAAQVLNGFLIEGGAGLNTRGVDFADAAQSSQWGADVFKEDIKKRQTILKEDLDSITAPDFDGLSPMQRLYALSTRGRDYLSGEYKIKLGNPHRDGAPPGGATVVEMAQIHTLDELIRFELYNTLKYDLVIRRCKYCGEYFVVRGRIDTEYCDRIKDGERKPCSIIGATRNYWGGKTSDPVYAGFQKAYKRAHSRRRVGKMTQSEFNEWSKLSRAKRDECAAGRLSIEEFEVWLRESL